MDIKYSFKGLETTIARLNDISTKRLPKVTAIALTATAKRMQTWTVAEMQRVFSKPTPWVLGGVYITPALYNKLQADVWFKNSKDSSNSKSGRPTADIISPHIYGGGRSYKGVEKALYRFGRIQSGQYVMPGKFGKLNQYGNIGSGDITRFLTAANALQGMSDMQTSSRRGRPYKLRNTSNLFFGRPGAKRTKLIDKKSGIEYGSQLSGGRQLGIYQRMYNGSIRPLMVVVDRKPQYRKRLLFFENGKARMPRWFKEEFSRVARETIAYHTGKA